MVSIRINVAMCTSSGSSYRIPTTPEPLDLLREPSISPGPHPPPQIEPTLQGPETNYPARADEEI